MMTNLRLLMLAAVMVLLSAHLDSAPYAMSGLQDYSDEFNSSILDPKWTFENPAPNPSGQSWSLTTHPGYLNMTTTGPTDLIGETNTAPRMLEEAPTGDFSIVVRVLALPDVLFEHAGILVIESPTSWVRLIRDSRYNSVYLQTGPSAAGTYIEFTGSDVVLKLNKVGSSYDGFYSTNGGVSFSHIGQVEGPALPLNIGTTVASTPEDNVFSAQFDYFRVSDVGSANAVPSTSLSLKVLLVLALITISLAVRRRLSSKA